MQARGAGKSYECQVIRSGFAVDGGDFVYRGQTVVLSQHRAELEARMGRVSITREAGAAETEPATEE